MEATVITGTIGPVPSQSDVVQRISTKISFNTRFWIVCVVDWSLLVSTASSVLSNNGIIAVPTDTIYGVAGLAQSSAAIGRLYEVKGRSCTKPVAISVASVDEIYQWVFVLTAKPVWHCVIIVKTTDVRS